MPVPTTLSDLSLTPASNSPAGSDAIGNSLDDYLRSIQAILRSTNAISTSTIASAATVDVGASDAEVVTITGTTTITSLGTATAGLRRVLRFNGALTLTDSANLILPGDITTQADDVLVFRSLGSGQWILEASSRPEPLGGRIRSISAGTTPTTGTGVELYFDTTDSYLVSIDRATTTFKRMRVYGSPVYLHHGVNVVAETSASGFTVTGLVSATTSITAGTSVSDAGGNVRRIPVTTQNSNYTFALSDLGKVVRKDGATAIAYTIDPEGTTAYGDGFIVTARNANAAGNITLTRGSGVTLRLAGSSTDQNVTIAPWGQATLIREASNVWVVTGTGLS